MKACLLLLVINSCWVALAYPQQEMNKWFFGYNGGLDFDSGVPVTTFGNLRSWEGCSAISDKNGNLLFYTDGITVWNRLHQVMPQGTGLLGDTLATQSVLITGYPGNDSLFYIFTVDKEAEPDGLQYSIVNMKLDGGLGDIITAQKNIPLLTPVCEKVAAVKHPNTNDIWLITHKFGSNEFYVYLLDCAGLHTTPLIFPVGNIVDRISNAIGYLKVSGDGSRLAMASFSSEVEVFDFDAVTGRITRPRIIVSNPEKITGPYGLEFSRDAKRLYVSASYNKDGTGYWYIFQYSLDTPAIADSRIAIDSGYANSAGALQMGPDEKIYIAYDQQPFLGAITAPDKAGTGCGHVRQYVHLPAGITSGVGLPSAVAGYDRTLLGKDTAICAGARMVIRLNLSNTTYRWQNGSLADSLVITGAGTYSVTIDHNNCRYSDSINISIRPGPAFSLGNDTVLCNNAVLLLDIGAVDQCLWQDGSTQHGYQVNHGGLYYVTASKNNCSKSDSIAVSYQVRPVPNLGPDGKICPRQELVLNPGATGSYRWQDGKTTTTYKVSEPGTYSVAATNQCGTGVDEIVISRGDCPLGIPNAFTPGKETNRIFRMINGAGLKKFTLRVYSRWGQLVFQTNDPSSGWNGSYNGVLQPPGAYVYTITYTDPFSAKDIFQKGLLTLIR